MLNPGVPKCDEDLITLKIYYVEQGKTRNLYKLFIYMPQHLWLFGGPSGGGGGRLQ